MRSSLPGGKGSSDPQTLATLLATEAQGETHLLPTASQGALALDLAGQSEFGSLIGREGRAIRVEISAGRLEQAESWAETVRRRLAQLPTLVDARLAYAGSQPVIEVEFQRDEIAQHGVSLEAVAEAIGVRFPIDVDARIAGASVTPLGRLRTRNRDIAIFDTRQIRIRVSCERMFEKRCIVSVRIVEPLMGATGFPALQRRTSHCEGYIDH